MTTKKRYGHEYEIVHTNGRKQNVVAHDRVQALKNVFGPAAVHFYCQHDDVAIYHLRSNQRAITIRKLRRWEIQSGFCDGDGI